VNQLHNLLARLFPELATVVAKVRSPRVLALLERYPTPALLARARAQSLANIPYLRQEKALQLQQVARRTVGTLQGEVAETLVRETLREIVLSRSIEKRLHRLMRTVFHSLPDGPHRLLTTIAGIGDATAAAIVANVVSIDRFTTPEQLVNYFGVFPEPNTSGFDRRGNPVPPGTMHMSRQGNDLVRRYLWMAAQSATLHNAPVRKLFARQKARGKRGDVSLGHCMRKLLHQVFAVWTTGRPFDADYESHRHAARDANAPSDTPSQNQPQETQKAAGHTEVGPQRPVVTAANSKVESAPVEVNARPVKIDYTALRRQATMKQVLEQLGCLPRLTGSGTQRRGPCPTTPSPTIASGLFQCRSTSTCSAAFTRSVVLREMCLIYGPRSIACRCTTPRCTWRKRCTWNSPRSEKRNPSLDHADHVEFCITGCKKIGVITPDAC
jgi:transposase